MPPPWSELGNFHPEMRCLMHDSASAEPGPDQVCFVMSTPVTEPSLVSVG